MCVEINRVLQELARLTYIGCRAQVDIKSKVLVQSSLFNWIKLDAHSSEGSIMLTVVSY